MFLDNWVVGWNNNWFDMIYGASPFHVETLLRGTEASIDRACPAYPYIVSMSIRCV